MKHEEMFLVVWGAMMGFFAAMCIVSVQDWYHEMQQEQFRAKQRDIVELRRAQREPVFYTPPPYEPSQTIQGSCGGACNRPIDESKLRIAPAKETRSELAEMLDDQTEKK